VPVRASGASALVFPVLVAAVTAVVEHSKFPVVLNDSVTGGAAEFVADLGDWSILKPAVVSSRTLVLTGDAELDAASDLAGTASSGDCFHALNAFGKGGGISFDDPFDNSADLDASC
jgi:hypothetical protein